MENPMNVCVLVGSLRKASLNGMLANALMSLAPSSMKLEIVEIGQLPFFNQDLETDSTPAQWTTFRQRVKAADAVPEGGPLRGRRVGLQILIEERQLPDLDDFELHRGWRERHQRICQHPVE